MLSCIISAGLIGALLTLFHPQTEFEMPIDVSTSDIEWAVVSKQVDGAIGPNQSYKAWVPNIEGPKDVVVMMHIANNPIDNTGYVSDWIDHTYWFDGENSGAWNIGDVLADMAESHPFILISPNYGVWGGDRPYSFLQPEAQEELLRDIQSKFDVYKDRSHYVLGGASLGANWTSIGITYGLSDYYGTFIIGSDSTRNVLPLDNIVEALSQLEKDTVVWCINGTNEGEHTAQTWNALSAHQYDHVTVNHVQVTNGQHLYATWVSGLRKVLENNA